MKSSGIGGQAVMEGVMMKNKNTYAVAVRKSNKEIEVQTTEFKPVSSNERLYKIPILRGILNFIDSLSLGMKSLSFSASFFEEDEAEEKNTKMEKFIEKVFKVNADDFFMGCTMLLSVVLAVALFMLLPYYISDLIGRFVKSHAAMAAIEGIIRFAIFMGYMAAISVMKDIQRLYMYHGAEHKCINCIENGMKLNVENVKKSSRLHKRCGTSFMLIIIIVSIIFGFFIRTDSKILRIVIRLLLIPVIAGVSYEFIRLAGKSDNKIVNFFSKPGLALQKLTTREPDDDMIEVAIASVEAVFDWKEFLNDNKNSQVEENKSESISAKLKNQKSENPDEISCQEKIRYDI